MVPTRKPLFNGWHLAVYFAVYMVLAVALDMNWLLELALAFFVYAATRYLWCTTEAYGPAARTIPAGDPRPWQFWRWMDIDGPSATTLDVSQMAHTELYLRRLYLLRTPWFGLMLHWIKREDWDRDALHDHPWEFWRFIVSGGYIEELAYPYGSVVYAVDHRRRNQLQPSKLVTHRWLRASKFPTGAYHRITSVKPRTVSFVINGPKSNSWGFFVPGTGKVPWRDYVNGAR